MTTSLRTRVRFFALIATAALAGSCIAQQTAQQPKVIHASFRVENGSLQQTIASVQTPGWVGYQLATTHPLRSGWEDNVLHLEGVRGDEEQQHVIDPEAPTPPTMVLLRVVSGQVMKVRVEEMDRQIDGGGLSFVWVGNVSGADSVKTLKAVVETNTAREVPVASDDKADRAPNRDARRVQDGALVAIALGDAPEGTAALQSFTTAKYPEDLRDRAAFWLANERGAEGFATVSNLLRTEQSQQLREKLVFDLTLVKGDSHKAAVDELLSLAKSDASPAIRSKAQFWLAQAVSKQPDSRVTELLDQQASNDPNAAIRKSAVFALSRLPASEGIPKLVQLASTTSDAATRREAIFWLGQSRDPQALAYLEKLVTQ
jgi:hypothetical protein